MRLGKNTSLFGALLILIGAYVLFAPKGINLGYLPWLGGGLALLLLYYGKRKAWALVLGVILVEMSVYSALKSFGFPFLKLHCVLFFFIPGTIFMVLFLTKGMQGLLIPASVLLWTGAGITVEGLPVVPQNLSVLTLCFGMAFITIYLLGHLRISKNYLYLGIVVCIFGLYSFIEPFSFMNIGKLGWLAVGALCIMLLLKARKKSKKDEDSLDG